MKIKHSLIIIAIGWAMVWVGAFFKINHSGYSEYFLTSGLSLSIIGGMAFIYKLVSHPKIKEFLNS
ncbi:MAG: hypothetical protein KDC79_03510 [Cyclobacteriaceae bacterium]|nr:hypothetical protein [Cyclobacteriaceae bacterium]